MKLFVLGKRGSVTHWAEDAVAGFAAAGHDVRFGGFRSPGLYRFLEGALFPRWADVPLAVRLARAISRFAPDLILVLTAYFIPPPVLGYIARLPHRPPLFGWVGDRFSAESAATAALFDAVAYTDTGLLSLHKEIGFASPAIYLPHAANPRLTAGQSDARQQQMVFVANPTAYRLAFVRDVRTPLQLYGQGWRQLRGTNHRIHPRRIGVDELATVYRTHLAVLNVRNEHNVVAGLNQRHFDPYLAATPVVADDQGDLPLCFEPGREMLVYRDVDELNDLYIRLQRQPEFAAAIGNAGRRRVLAEHTYGHRLAAYAKLA